MKNTKLLVLFLLSISISSYSQPPNDECASLIDFGEGPICPIIDTFNNVNASGSLIFSDMSLNIPACFNGSTPNSDVWFSFTVPADGSVVDFQIDLSGVDGPNGSITQPQMAVYRGDCMLDGLDELLCVTSLAGEVNLTLDLPGLTPGITYYLRIEDWSATAAPNWGDFELCIKEPDQVFNMGTDLGSTSCNGTLFDSGGLIDPYQNNENNTFTICPSDPTGCISIDIVSTTIENNFDNLNFYEGTGTLGNPVWNFTGFGGATSLDMGSDCVTIEFTSDGSVTQDGFELNWSCSNIPCETDLFPCQETENIGNLPFSQTGNTTCGSGDDLDNGPCISGAPILAGEDFVFTYTPFNNGCIDIILSAVNLSTGLSVYDGCPESATTCLAQSLNIQGDTVSILNLNLTAFEQIFIVVSNGTCTNFSIDIQDVECPPIQNTLAFCEEAYLLNRCEDIPTNFTVTQETSPIAAYFQPTVNDGCWSDEGAAHYTWFIFQAQQNGDFSFLAQNGNTLENSNIDIQVWGPIDPDGDVCTFISNNQPVRSTGANSNPTSGGLDITGLTNTHPVNGSTIFDECESLTGDGFITALPVNINMVYVVLVNDKSGNIVTGGIDYDFSFSSPGILDGLLEGSFYNVPEYILSGDAFYNSNLASDCIQMTGDINTQLSCVWLPEQVDFSVAFTNTIIMNFGSNNGGADGMTLVYQTSPEGSTACGISGGQIGAGGITNSLIIEFDTWQNADLGDPVQDHIAVNINGDMSTTIAGPQILPNIEDGVDHEVTFAWEASINTYQIFFDGVLQITGTMDVVTDLFDGSSMAFCGFTGSTGGASNLQYVCTGDNVFPTISRDTISLSLCEGESLLVGGGTQTTDGFYTDAFTSIEGCDSLVITSLSFTPPSSMSFAFTLCEGQSFVVGGVSYSTSGTYSDTLISVSNCDSIINTELTFLPNISENQSVTLCEGESIFVGGAEQTTAGTYMDTYMAMNGCDSTVIVELFFINTEIMIADPEFLSCEVNCITLDATGSSTGANITYQWSNNGNIIGGQNTLTPSVCEPGIYELTVIQNTIDVTCTSSIEITVDEDLTIACGYEIPNAFTPDGDGLNDVFELVTQGNGYEIISLKIFNRWGQKVHSGSGTSHAWDGYIDDKSAPSDVYAYLFFLRDAAGEEIVESGDLTLIR